jgi:uncharacterized protein (DUF1697 family)
VTIRMFAFIRAINTGGRRLTNADLLEPFVSAGLHDVAAYQAAGNVTFRSDRAPDDLEAELTDRLAEAYGFDAPTFVRTATQLRAAVDGHPFDPEEVARTEGRIQLTFLAAAPTAAQVTEVIELVPTDDLVAIADRHWYWLPRAGVSTSALPVTRIERILGPMTMRTLATAERMLTRFDS